MTRFTYRRGAALAALCAGPVYVLPIIFVVVLKFGAAEIPGLILMFAISIPLGLMAALLPIFLGGYVMAFWGSCNPRARHPALWGMAGAVLATPIAILLYGAEGDISVGATFGITGMFALTGAICALIVRYGTRWSDDNPSTTPQAISACAEK